VEYQSPEMLMCDNYADDKTGRLTLHHYTTTHTPHTCIPCIPRIHCIPAYLAASLTLPIPVPVFPLSLSDMWSIGVIFASWIFRKSQGTIFSRERLQGATEETSHLFAISKVGVRMRV
jgi:hypothetical protein